MPNPVVGRDPEATGAEPKSSFGDILTQFEQTHASQGLARGDGREGTVISVTGDSVFVDIGMKIEGIVPAAEFRDKSGAVAVQPGDKLRVAITGRDDEGYHLLSKLKVQRPKDWAGLEKALQEKRSIAGVVSGVVKGGLSVDIGVRAFMPASRSGAKDAAELEKLVGREITCKIIKVDVADEDVVVDRRAILEEEEAHNREQRLAELKEGATVQGTVRTLTDFGAFVDIGGVDGLLHVTELSWSKKVRKPSDVVKPGDAVEAVVLGVNPSERRISLGLKQAMGDPWAQAENRFPAGTVVEGPITSLTKFGAFVQLDEALEGMIHVGDISAEKRINHPQDVLKVGQAVRAAVLEVDREKRRVRLGLKQLQPTSIDEYIVENKDGDLVSGRVANIARGKATVELGEGIQASCNMAAAESNETAAAAEPAKADLSALSSMLAAKWKHSEARGSSTGKREPALAGQIRRFRIVRLDPAQKKIELELAS